MEESPINLAFDVLDRASASDGSLYRGCDEEISRLSEEMQIAHVAGSYQQPYPAFLTNISVKTFSRRLEWKCFFKP